MSVFYNGRDDMLKLKCDSCRKIVDLYKGETDRLLAHDWIHEHGRKTIKIKDIWINVCPACKEAIEAKHRERFIESIEGEFRK